MAKAANKSDGRENNGGLPGVGRKPMEDKKVNVSLYVRQSRIDTLGGKDKVREIALAALAKKLK